MTQREKLIELLKVMWGCTEPCSECGFEKTRCDCKDVADYLIARNGVVLPCKVGDTVYRVYDGDYEQFVVTGINVRMSGDFLISAECDIHGYGFYNYRKCKENFCGRSGACYTQFYDFDIGRTIFLTREKAEKALKKMEGEK